MFRLQRITRDQFHALLGTEAPPSLDEPAVIAAADGRFAKTFRQPKHLLSSARWRPYAMRFARAADELARRGIATVRVTGLYRITDAARDAVVYEPLAGTPLRTIVADASQRDALLARFAAFVADLHRRGIAFPGMHLDNVLVRPDGGFGLIDITSVRCRPSWRGPLPARGRARDLRPMFNYEPDRAAVTAFGVERFIDAYLAAATLNDGERTVFLRSLGRQHPLLAQTLARTQEA